MGSDFGTQKAPLTGIEFELDPLGRVIATGLSSAEPAGVVRILKDASPMLYTICGERRDELWFDLQKEDEIMFIHFGYKGEVKEAGNFTIVEGSIASLKFDADRGAEDELV